MCYDVCSVDDFRNPATGFCIDNAGVYGLYNAMAAARLPKNGEYSSAAFEDDIACFGSFSDHEKRIENRANVLAACAGGESHDCFLCGAVVQMNITAPRYWWPEFQRYHFADIVSSTSTMHRLKDFVKRCIELQDAGKHDELDAYVASKFSPKTHIAVINGFLTSVAGYVMQDKFDVGTVKACLPEGWLQTARITTNYRQLKTMYRQRHNHPLAEWRDFCGWMGCLPYGKWITGQEDKQDGKGH